MWTPTCNESCKNATCKKSSIERVECLESGTRDVADDKEVRVITCLTSQQSSSKSRDNDKTLAGPYDAQIHDSCECCYIEALLPIKLWIVPVQAHGILETAFTLKIFFDTFLILEIGIKSLEE